MQRMRLRRSIRPAGWCLRDAPPLRQLERGGHNLILPLRSYRYDQARALVQAGDEVRSGQPLSEACGLLSRPRLAPASGRVLAVENRALADGCRVPCVLLQVSAPDEAPLDPQTALSAQGMESSEGLPLDYELELLGQGGILLINCVETEFGQRSRRAALRDELEHPRLAPALQLLLERCRPASVWIAFDDHQEEDALALKASLAPLAELRPLKLSPDYPSAHPLLLARRLARLEAALAEPDPLRPLPSQGLLVLGMERLALLQRRLQVGPADRFLISWARGEAEAEVLEVPSGLPLQALLDGTEGELLLGSLLTGSRAPGGEMPLLPPLRTVFAPDPGQIADSIEDACITCGLCLDACPQNLAPPRLAHLIEEQRLEEARRMGLNHCLHCGICSWVCPSRIHLGHSLRKGRWLLREARDES